MKRQITSMLLLGCALLSVAQLKTVTANGSSPDVRPQGVTEHQGIQLNPSNRLNYAPETWLKLAAVRNTPANTLNATARVAALPSYADMPLLYGCLYRTEDWNTVSPMPQGIYSFHPGQQVSYFNESVPGPAQGMASFYANGKFYVLDSATAADYITVEASVTEYDAQTWEVLRGPIALGDGSWDYYFRQVGVYDPATNKAYTFSWGDSKPMLSIDLETLEFTVVGRPNLFIQTLFLDKDNNLYGVDFTDSGLYLINKDDASTTLVGTLDLPFSLTADQMAAVTDPVSGITYWITVDRDSKQSYLYTIDTADAHCTLITELPQDEHFYTLYIPAVNADAPAAATGNKYENGMVKFVAPTTTYTSGAELTGNLTAAITIDGQKETLSVEPGQEVSLEKELSVGAHVVSVVISNEVGNGPERRYNAFVGSDAPSSVLNISYVLDNNVAQLSWEAPNASMFGGPFDDEAVRYNVVRYPDQTVVATDLTECSYTETLPETRDHYYYGIIPTVGELIGQETLTNALSGGSVYNVPFVEDFQTQADFDFGKVIDNNMDGRSWSFAESYHAAFLWGNGSTEYYGEGEAPFNDDYYITGAMKLYAGIDYRLSVTFSEGYFREDVRLLLGTSQNVAGDQTILKDHISIPYGTLCKEEVVFNVPTDGLYYVLIHDNTVGNSVMLIMDDFSVTIEGAFNAPDCVSALTATAGKEGAISNVLTFTTPTTTYSGDALEAISRIDIYKNGSSRVYATIDAPEVGATIQWADPTPQAGIQTYAVVPFNEQGQGRTAIITNWVGIDVPAAPAKVRGFMTENIQPGFEWAEASAEGEHGGYVKTEDVKYRVYRYNEWSWDNPWVLTLDGITDITAVDDTYFSWSSEEWPNQEYLDYAVVAYNEAGESMMSGVGVTVGHPFARPFTESFGFYGMAEHSPWTLHTDSYSYAWNIVTGEGMAVKPYDNDGGMLQFSVLEPTSDRQVIEGPRISLKDAVNPELSFYMYHGNEADEGDTMLKLYINVDDQGFVEVANVDYNNGVRGWARHAYALPTGANNVILAFGAKAYDASASIFIDKIMVDEGVENDLQLMSINATKRVNNGETGEVTVTVNNLGQKTTGAFVVNLNRDGELYDSAEYEGLPQNQIKAFTFEVPTTIKDATKTYAFSAEVVYAADSNADNNASEVVEMYVTGSPYPTPGLLSGEVNGSDVVLSWEAPSTDEFVDEVTEGFDDYEAFIIDEIGDWKVYDGDGSVPVYFGGPAIPNAFEVQAWQVWNPEEAGFSIDRFSMLRPHSGAQYLANWSASDGTSSILPNDDWLISSDVLGGTDVSFWACNPNEGAAAQKFEVLYSTTDNEPENFEVLGAEALEGTIAWVYYIYTLPADAKYFAIRSCGDGYVNRTVLFIDDITYTPLYGATSKLEMDGYKVYRDGEFIAKTEHTTYTDTDAAHDMHVYNVTANWVKGESLMSNDVTVNVSAIGDMAANRILVRTGKNVIRIANCEDCPVMISTTDGKVLYNAKAAGSVSVNVSAGIYIVRAGNTVEKVIVK